MKLKTTFLLTIIFFLGACTTDFPIIEDKDDLIKYHKKRFPTKVSQCKTPKVYIDYSGGMHTKVASSFDFINSIVTILTQKNVEFYSVGVGVDAISGNVFESSHPKNPRKAENYSDNRSDLDEALKKITSDATVQSIFVTDFELFKTGYDPTPWAVLMFDEWLAKQGRIDVFAKLTDDGGIKRPIYLLVFTPVSCLSDNPFLERLYEEGYMKGKEGVTWFSFSDEVYKVEKNAEELVNEELSSLDEYTENERFEFYVFDVKDIKETLELVDNQDKYLFKNLVYKNQSQIFKNVKFECKAYNITKEFQKTGKAEEVTNVFTFSTTQKDEDYSFQINLSDKFKGLNENRKLFRIDIYAESADLLFDESKMDEYLQWYEPRARKDIVSLNQSVKEAAKRLSFSKKLLFSFYLEMIQ